MRTQTDLLETIGNRSVGDEVAIRLERAGKPLDVTAKLVARPGTTARTTEKAPYLGISVVETDGEVQVREVDKRSPAGKGGVKTGWRIVKFAETDIKTVRDFLNAVKKSKPGESVELTVRKSNRKEYVLKLEMGTVPSDSDE